MTTMTHPATEMDHEDNAAFNPHVTGMRNDGTGPLTLDHDETRGLTYKWYNISRRRQDYQSRERGYIVSRIEVEDTHGDVVAYLNITHSTRQTIREAFPTTLHWFEDRRGHNLGLRWSDEPENIYKATVWAYAHNALRRVSPTVPMRSWSYSPDDAPSDKRVLAAEINALRDELKPEMKAWTRRLVEDPFVDYSRVNVNLRGTGIGSRMYILAAQHLATYGKALRGSGLQTEEAQRLWERLAADPTLPVKTVRRRVNNTTYTHRCLDYRR